MEPLAALGGRAGHPRRYTRGYGRSRTGIGSRPKAAPRPGLLRELLPAPLGRRIAWPNPAPRERHRGRRRGPRRAAHGPRLLGARPESGACCIYVLAEHQSKVDPWMASACSATSSRSGRASAPSTRAPGSCRRSSRRGPPQPDGLDGPVAFEDLLDADAELLDALGPYVPRFRFLLDDLSAQSDAELRARTQDDARRAGGDPRR